jgi:prolipoprotein diacylglyceryltransferase
MYSFIRFSMELLRTDTSFRLFGISRNGWISVVAFISGWVWIWYMHTRTEKRMLVGEPYLLSPQAATTTDDEQLTTQD